MTKLDELDEQQQVKKPVRIAKPGDGLRRVVNPMEREALRTPEAAAISQKLTDETSSKNAKSREHSVAAKAKSAEKISRKITHRGKSRLKSNQGKTLLAKRRVVGYGLRNFTRNAWLTIAATIVMTITLLIVFATLVASMVLNETITAQRAKMDMSIYVKSDVSDDILANLKGKLQIQPNVVEVRTSDSQEQYSVAVEANKDNPSYTQGLATAAQIGTPVKFPALITVKFRDPNQTENVKKFIANDPQFKEWVDVTQNSADSTKIQQTTVDRLSDVMNNVQRVGLGAVVLFVIISTLIVFNTIRMAIFSRREEIDMMKAIGADRSFIRGPFLVEAELYGVIAAAISIAIGYLAVSEILPSLGNYFQTTNTISVMREYSWLIIIAMAVIGFLIGGISARLAVRRYLKG